MSNWQRFYSMAALALAVVRLTEKFVILSILVKCMCREPESCVVA